MKSLHRVLLVLTFSLAASLSEAATQFSARDYNLYPGDFNGDGRTDLLYIGKSPDKANGIALADSSGAPQIGFQSWPATYLGVQWSTGAYVPVVGDFNGDGKSDILMQAATAGTSYLLLANTNTAIGAVGQIVGINQGISQSSFGIEWSADKHKILVGDFDGDLKDDVLLQTRAKGGTNAIVLADGAGNLFTRSSSYCWAGGPQQCWTDGEQGLSWSTVSSVLTVGRFNADVRADILVQARPDIIFIDYDIPIPVLKYKPNTFGLFLGQVPDGAGKIIRTINQVWNQNGLGANWSPVNSNVLVGDFNGDTYTDILLQARGTGSNLMVYSSASGTGVLSTATAPAGTVAAWNGGSYNMVVGKFGNSSRSVLYLQALGDTGTNYYTSDVSAGSASTYASSLQIVAALPVTATTIGATPATADVTQNGLASYSIPIQIPRGTAGLTPDLSLTYSSGAGNGLVGVGWNISGLGIIARCPQTLAQDNVTQGVQLVTADQYCLNGNRLRLISGTQGAAGSVYRTELETFARITAVGTGTQGPTSFTVETKDGLVSEYGSTAESRIGVPGNTSITRVWALNKVRDRAFNQWLVTYTNLAGSYGSYRPDRIDYTSNSAQGTSAPYRVQFYYENRNTGENVISYYGGGQIIQNQRLQRIEFQTSAAAMVKKYTLVYQTPASTFSAISRLSSVQECSPTACMAATTFGWSDTPLSAGMPTVGTTTTEYGLGAYSVSNAFPPASATINAYSLDINGDGRPDAVQLARFDNNGVITVGMALFIGTPTGQVAASYSGSYVDADGGVVSPYDIDEDGKEDLLFGAKWLHQKTDGTYALEANPVTTYGGVTIDVDGDGYLDLVGIVDSTHLNVRFHKHDGTLGFEATTSTVWTAPAGTTIPQNYFQTGYQSAYVYRQSITHADINGDGRQDMLVQVNNGWRALYSNGATFTTGELIVPVSGSASGNIIYFTPVPIDMNGDGCTEFAYPKTVAGTDYWYLAVSSCGIGAQGLTVDVATSIAVAGLNMALYLNDSGYGSAADVNGDGNQDLISGPNVLLSNGSTLLYVGSESSTIMWGDRNGDGVLDSVLCNPGCGIGYTYRPGLGKRPNQLVSAMDGFGKSVTFEYTPLTAAGVYTRGTTGIGRTQDIGAPLYVVKSMTLSDGIGGTYSQTYSYAGAKRNIRGRGFLGFSGRTVVDSRTGFVTQEVYNNSVNSSDGSQWEFVGTLASKTVRQSAAGPLVEELTQQYNSVTPTGNSTGRYPYVGTAVVKKYELTGTNSPVSTATTVATIDGYGTPYDVTTTTVEGISGLNAGSQAVQRRYTPTANILNDTTNWCLSRPQRLEEARSHTLTDGAAITRVSTQVWDAPKCRVTNTTLEPGAGVLQLDTLIEYDLFNNVNKTTVTGTGITTRISEAYFGTNGHLLQWVQNAKGHRTYFTYAVSLGFKTSQTDPNGLVTTWVPDDFGREVSMTRPDGTSTYKTYFNCTQANSYCGDSLLRYVVRTEERNSSGGQINYSDQFVDVMGRVKYEQSKAFNGQTVVTESMYDNRGNIVLKTNPYLAGAGSVSGVSMTYDNLNRLTATQHPMSDNNATQVIEWVSYNGLTVTTTDGNANTQVKISSVWGTIQRATDELGKITNYTYNGFGDLRTVTDPLLNVTSLTYNIRGFKSTSNDPDLGSWSYTYDALGQMLTQTDAKAQTTTFTYDVLGRTATREDHPGGAGNRTTWTWDGPGGVSTPYGIGQLNSVSAPGGYSESYVYDNKSRRSQMTTVANGSSYVMDYTYDTVTGRPLTVTYPTSTGTRLAVRYGYQNGFLLKAEDYTVPGSPTLLWQANAQDARGHVTQEQFGNGQITNLGFDQTNGRLYTVQTGPSGGSTTQNLSYTWDAVGSLTSRRDNTQALAETFTYDPLYRLMTVQRNGATTLTMGYNDIGNVTSKSDVGSYTYPASGGGSVRPHAVSTAAGNSYTYDANGNMSARAGATVTWSTYNYPTTINQTGGNTSTFYYGADRNRYRQVSVDAGVTEDRVTVAGGAFEKLVRGGTIEYRHFVQANGKAVAIVKRSAQTGDEKYYLHDDHLGSTDVITDGAGAVVVRLSFDAWGQRRGSAWTGTPSAADKTAISASTHQGYTGHEQLDNLNLVHMNGRVYDPVIARFMSADPIVQDPFHSQAFNRYSYIWNNPLNGTDPTGLTRDCVSRIGSHICEGKPDMGSITSVPSGVAENGGGEGATAPTSSTDAAKRSSQDSKEVPKDTMGTMGTPPPVQDLAVAPNSGNAHKSFGGRAGDSKTYAVGNGTVTLTGRAVSMEKNLKAIASLLPNSDLPFRARVEIVKNGALKSQDGKSDPPGQTRPRSPDGKEYQEYVIRFEERVLGDGVRRDNAYVSAALGHELVHVIDGVNGLWDTIGTNAAEEVRAYDWNIKNADAVGMSNSLRENFVACRDSYANTGTSSGCPH